MVASEDELDLRMYRTGFARISENFFTLVKEMVGLG